MKKLIATTAILMSLTSIALAQDRTAEYRMWSAEQMINRIADKMVRSRKVCDQAEYALPRLSEKCIASVLGAYPLLGKIREVAMTGDPEQWVKLIEIHKFEAEIEAPLNHLEGKAR